MRKLGKRQAGVLDALNKHGYWHLGCGWCWDTGRKTEDLMDRLVQLGYVERDNTRPPYYRPKQLEQPTQLTDSAKLALAMEGLGKAMNVIDYCGGGDAWERECNKPDMDRFYAICTQLGVGDEAN